MASGLGLSEFRCQMLAKLVDYGRRDAVFPGVDVEGEVSFFLWFVRWRPVMSKKVNPQIAQTDQTCRQCVDSRENRR